MNLADVNTSAADDVIYKVRPYISKVASSCGLTDLNSFPLCVSEARCYSQCGNF